MSVTSFSAWQGLLLWLSCETNIWLRSCDSLLCCIATNNMIQDFCGEFEPMESFFANVLLSKECRVNIFSPLQTPNINMQMGRCKERWKGNQTLPGTSRCKFHMLAGDRCELSNICAETKNKQLKTRPTYFFVGINAGSNTNRDGIKKTQK